MMFFADDNVKVLRDCIVLNEERAAVQKMRKHSANQRIQAASWEERDSSYFFQSLVGAK